MFSPFGKILDVKASRSLKKRGQAFIVFEDVQSASRAMKEMQGYPLFNKSIVGSS
jgi:U1 small nuclear ribonucleoprotein A